MSVKTTSKNTSKIKPKKALKNLKKNPEEVVQNVQKSSTISPIISKNTSQSDANFESKNISSNMPNNVSSQSIASSRKAHSKSNLLALFKNPQAQNILISVIAGTVSVCAILWFSLGFIPMVYDQTDTVKQSSSVAAAKEKEKQIEQEKQDLQKLIEQENSTLSFTNQKVKLSTSAGDFGVSLLDKNAPKTVENFVRLTSRNKYNNVSFHRLVKEAGFSVLQGGDYEKQTGFGGKSAFGGFFDDELWEVSPVLNAEGAVTNNPVFRGGEGYTNYNKERNFVTIPKGYLAMANSGSNTNGSQFFIILQDTQLPAAYTVFGKVNPEDFAILDKIYNENQTVMNQSGTAQDKPAKDIILISAKIV